MFLQVSNNTALADQFQKEIDKVAAYKAVVIQFATQVVGFLPKLISSAIILVIFLVLQKFVVNLAEKGMKRLQWEPAVRQLLKSALKITILGFGIITVAGQLGINVTSLIAGVGVASFAISFAAKDSLENLISGITILIDKPFRVNDLIEVEGAFGTVEEITLRSTRIRTRENYIKIIPNTTMVQSQITNRSMVKTTRVFETVGISYGSDIDRARKVILELLESDERVEKDPAPKVAVEALADSSVNLLVNFTIKDPNLEIPIRFEYFEKIKKALVAAGIEIPFPCRTIYMQKTDNAA